MSDWIDSKPEVAQSTSKLPVIPSSPDQPKPTASATIPLAVPVAVPAKPDPGLRAGHPTRSKTPLAIPEPGANSWALVATDGEASRPDNAFELSKFSYLYLMPSWLVSFILHLVLLLLLALLTFGSTKGPQRLSLEIGDADSVADIQMFESVINFDSDALEDQSPELESFEEEKFSTESELELTESLMADLKSGLAVSSGTDDQLEATSLVLSRGDGKSAKFFGAGAKGTKFVFVIDCSGSMNGEYRWNAAIRELKAAIEGLTKQQLYYVFLYNQDSYGMTQKEPKLVRANPGNRQKTFAWLDDTYPFGGTEPWNALKASLDLKPDAIFLLSDGEIKDNSVVELTKVNIDREKDRYKGAKYKIPVHTIFLGNGFGEQTMQTIAEQNNGTFTKVRN